MSSPGQHERNIDYSLRWAPEQADEARASLALSQGADPNGSIVDGAWTYSPLAGAAWLIHPQRLEMEILEKTAREPLADSPPTMRL